MRISIKFENNNISCEMIHENCQRANLIYFIVVVVVVYSSIVYSKRVTFLVKIGKNDNKFAWKIRMQN